MISGLRVVWTRQGPELVLLVRKIDEEPYRATLFAIADDALAGEPPEEVNRLADLLLNYHGRVANDPAWVTILGAAMLPVPLSRDTAEDVHALLCRLRAKRPPAYGPWLDVTRERAAGLAPSLVTIILWSASKQIGRRPFAWTEPVPVGPSQEPDFSLYHSEAAMGGRLVGPDGWTARLRRRFRGISMPRTGDLVTITIDHEAAGHLVLDPTSASLGCRLEFDNRGGRLLLPPWSPDLYPPIRLASLPGDGVDNPQALALATRVAVQV